MNPSIYSTTLELIYSPYFKDCAKRRTKEGARLRMFRIRFLRGLLTTGACVDMLEYFKYEIDFTIRNKPELVFHEDCDS